MRAFHDSRAIEYRSPYGAIELGASVSLVLDVWDAPNASVTLRTWVDGVGEGLQPMKAVQPGAGFSGEGAADTPIRFQTTLTPEAGGIVWYQFIIDDGRGTTLRYGAQEGCFGGPGQLRDWEPPSFQLTVLDAARRKVQAEELDYTLGRPFTDAVIGFLRGNVTAQYLAETLETLRENQPRDAFKRSFLLFDGYSCPDLLLALVGAPTAQESHAEGRAINSLEHLDPGQLGLAKGRLWCASLIQMLLPCTPAVRDAETGEDVLADSLDASLPWDYADDDCKAIIDNVLDLRRTVDLFRAGNFRCYAVNDDVLEIWHCNGSDTEACLLVNRSLQNAYDVPVPLAGEAVSEVIGGYGVPALDVSDLADAPLSGIDRNTLPAASSYALPHLYQLGTAVLSFHPEQRLQQPMEPGLGILAHITSLPPATGSAGSTTRTRKPSKASATQPGTLGEQARRFVDWLAAEDVRYWQVLPVNPTDEHGSPYAGISAFAGNVRLLEGDPKVLVEEADTFAGADYREFCERERDWLEPYAAFMAIRQKRRSRKVWQEWPKKLHRFDPELVTADAELARLAEGWRRSQFAFERQWRDLRAYANERGVQIIGDMPIYVSADSSDVWANPGIFQLEPDGRPSMVAGCPPDQFAVDGQIWGNPVYDWDALEASGWDWWLRRLERAFDLYDYVRLDHFIGFCRYFSIPAGEEALAGSYRPGPGLRLFRAAYEKFGPLPLVAEDLGMITPAVRALVDACGFPGMDILQFVDGNDPLSGYRPRPEKIAYTGTHDNQTLLGYVRGRYTSDETENRAVAEKLLEAVKSCDAPVRILALQDVLGLDDDARMNTPGTTEGNWTWQLPPEEMERLPHVSAPETRRE